MKREELLELGVAPEALDQIMALNGRDIEKHKATARQWEEKHGADTAALQTQLDEARYGRAVDAALQSMAFSSVSAKKAFAAELSAAGLPLEDGALAGLDAFTDSYRQSDPAAFTDAAPDAPVFVRPTGGTASHPGPSAALRAAFGLNE